jgi:sugar/nucleoside kinase (ribokinase family)
VIEITCAGILVADLIAADLPRVSPPGEITFAPRDIGVRAGGHAANVSIDLMRLGKNPGEISCLGAVGQDLFGEYLAKTLSEQQVAANLQKTAQAPTSVDLILVVKGEDRRYHADVGANAHLDPAFVRGVVEKETPQLFYAGGTGLMKTFDQGLTGVLRDVKKLGALTFVDPVMPYKKSWSYLRRAMKWIDIFHCNDREAMSLTSQAGPRRAIRTLAGWGPRLVLVTLGAEGVLAASRQRLLTMKSFRAPTLDPTGAGDAFCAGFICKLLQINKVGAKQDHDWNEDDLIEILLEAQAAGAACVTGIGTTAAVSRKNVVALLADQGAMVRHSLKVESL